MEEQEIPLNSGKTYRFIPAERNDTVRDTGRYIYLPVNSCGDRGENCKSIPRSTMVASGRRKRDIFSTLRDLHSIAGIEDPTDHPGFFHEITKNNYEACLPLGD